jgi:hypothetical protein
MSYLGDTLTVGLILVLLFGSIALYLYTRVQQSEQKISLLESIVLDLKLTGELQPFHEHAASSSSSADSASLSPASLPASPRHLSSSLEEESLPVIQEEAPASYKPFEEDGENELGSENAEESLPPLSAFSSSSLSPLTVSSSEMLEEITIHPMSPQKETASLEYESLSLKELQSLVRSRGLSVEKGSKKQVLLDALRKADSEVKPGSLSSSSFVEASSVLNDVE